MPAGLRFHTDQQLLQAIKEGQQPAMSMLFDKYAPAMQFTIHRITKNEELTEEVLQKSFCYIWQQAKQYDASKQNVLLWMMGIAKGIALRALKEKAGPQIHSLQNSVNNSGKMNGIESSSRQEMAVTDTEALTLVFVKGYSLEEAAKLLNLSREDLRIKLRNELNRFRGTMAK